MLTAENRKLAVDAQLRTEAFQSSFKTRVNLLSDTAAEIVDDMGAAKLAVEVLESQGVTCDGVHVACALRMRRLQFFVSVSPAARLRAAEEAKKQVRLKAAFAAPQPTGVSP